MVGHSAPLGGFQTPQTWQWDRLVVWSVRGFFAISCYLISDSRVRLPIGEFFRRRALRILPGFWVCLVGIAVGFAPVSSLLGGGEIEPVSAWGYVWRNLALWIFQPVIDATLADVPHGGVWNGSLWTLSFEAMAYVVAGLVLGRALARRHPSATGAALLVAAIGIRHLFSRRGGAWLLMVPGLELANFFFAGMILWGLRARVRLDGRWALLAVLACVVGIVAGQTDIVTPLPLAYLVLWAGAVSPTRIGAVNDLSYGMYVYAFPTQQLMAVAGGPRLGHVAYAALGLLATAPFAWLSWFGIERPALRLAHRRRACAAKRQGV